MLALVGVWRAGTASQVGISASGFNQSGRREQQLENPKSRPTGNFMASIVWNMNFTGFAAEIPNVISRATCFKAIYEAHQNRIFNFAFYLTDNEMTAEALTAEVFAKTFAANATPSAEILDQALINE